MRLAPTFTDPGLTHRGVGVQTIRNNHYTEVSMDFERLTKYFNQTYEPLVASEEYCRTLYDICIESTECSELNAAEAETKAIERTAACIMVITYGKESV